VIDSANLPPNILRRMAKKDRPKGNAGLLPEEAEAKQDDREERAIQIDIETDLLRRGIISSRPRMDRKSTIRKGWPDLTLAYCGRFVGLEVKTATGKLSPDQRDCLAALRKKPSRAIAVVVRSLAEVIELLAILDKCPAIETDFLPPHYRLLGQ
jgi:hypothetical protein